MAKLASRIGDMVNSFRAGRRRMSRELDAALGQEQARGRVRVARVEAHGEVARRALAWAALLSRDEEIHLQAAPLGENRYKVIADEFALYAAYEIGQPW